MNCLIPAILLFSDRPVSFCFALLRSSLTCQPLHSHSPSVHELLQTACLCASVVCVRAWPGQCSGLAQAHLLVKHRRRRCTPHDVEVSGAWHACTCPWAWLSAWASHAQAHLLVKDLRLRLAAQAVLSGLCMPGMHSPYVHMSVCPYAQSVCPYVQSVCACRACTDRRS